MFKNNLPLKLNQLEQENPDVEVELRFFDGCLAVLRQPQHPRPHEHRVGLKPILKKRMRPRADVRRKGTRTK